MHVSTVHSVSAVHACLCYPQCTCKGRCGPINACTHLLEDNGMPVELLSNAGGVLDLGRDREAQGRKLSDFTKQSDQSVAVMDPQAAIFVTQLHQTTASLQAE